MKRLNRINYIIYFVIYSIVSLLILLILFGDGILQYELFGSEGPNDIIILISLLIISIFGFVI